MISAPSEQISGQWKLYIPQLIFPKYWNAFEQNRRLMHSTLGMNITSEAKKTDATTLGGRK